MITFMRRYRRTLQIGLLVIVASFVASLFIFGTSARDGGAARDSVATVNGEKISVERYQRRYQEYLSMYAQMMRDRFSPEMAERIRRHRVATMARNHVRKLVVSPAVRRYRAQASRVASCTASSAAA